MSERKYSELKVGIFVFLAIVIIISVLFWAKGFMLTKDYIELKVYLQSASGLNLGDPVTISGVRKGKVKDIILVGDSVMVLFNLEKGSKIKTDYRIEVAIMEIMGGKQLFISPGKSNEEINYDKPLIGSQGGDISQLFKDANIISQQVKTLLQGFSVTNDNILKVVSNLNDIVSDKNMQKDLKSSLSSFASTSRSLNMLVNENRTTLKTLTDKAGITLDNVNGVLEQTTPEVKKSFEQIQILTAKVDSLVTSVNIITNDIVMKKSGLGKFINDDKFYDNLNKTLEEIEKLTKKIRQEGIKINLF